MARQALETARRKDGVSLNAKAAPAFIVNAGTAGLQAREVGIAPLGPKNQHSLTCADKVLFFQIILAW
jgi:hypothetical protein